MPAMPGTGLVVVGDFPIQIAPPSVSHRASASSMVATMIIREAPFARATAAVVKAWKVSMTAAAPASRKGFNSRALKPPICPTLA